MGESSDSLFDIFYNHVIRVHSRCRISRLQESGDSHYSLVILRGGHTTRIQNDQCPECRKNRKGVPWPSSDFSAFLHSWPTIGMDKQVISDQSRDSSINLVIRRQSPDWSPIPRLVPQPPEWRPCSPSTEKRKNPRACRMKQQAFKPVRPPANKNSQQ